MRSAVPDLHPVTRASFVSNPRFTTWPSILVWPGSTTGLLTRTFYFHPAPVWPRRYGPFAKTIDLDFVTNAIDDRDEIHVVTNSDEVLQTNLDLEGHLPNFLGHGPLEVAKVATWVGEHADALHRWLFVNFAIRIHADELDPEREAASASAERLTHDIIARVPAG